MGITGGPGAQCRGWGELQQEPWGGPLPRPPGVPASSVTGDRESRAQAQQGEGLQGWTLAAACRLAGTHSGEREAPSGREADYLAKLSSEPGARGAAAEGESEDIHEQPAGRGRGACGDRGCSPQTQEVCRWRRRGLENRERGQCRSCRARLHAVQVPVPSPPTAPKSNVWF